MGFSVQLCRFVIRIIVGYFLLQSMSQQVCFHAFMNHAVGCEVKAPTPRKPKHLYNLAILERL